MPIETDKIRIIAIAERLIMRFLRRVRRRNSLETGHSVLAISKFKPRNPVAMPANTKNNPQRVRRILEKTDS